MACNVEEVLKEVQDRLDKSKKGSEEYDQLLAVKSQLRMIKAVSSEVTRNTTIVNDIEKSNTLSNNKKILDKLAKIDGSKISETEGLWVMRNGNPNFGNPFYTVEPKNKLPGDIKVKDNDTASVMYYDWLKNNIVPNGANKKALDARREVILNNLDKVRTADKLRYAGTAKGKSVNHVKALLAVAEELSKSSINTKTMKIDTEKTEKATEQSRSMKPQDKTGAYGEKRKPGDYLR